MARLASCRFPADSGSPPQRLLCVSHLCLCQHSSDPRRTLRICVVRCTCREVAPSAAAAAQAVAVVCGLAGLAGHSRAALGWQKLKPPWSSYRLPSAGSAAHARSPPRALWVKSCVPLCSSLAGEVSWGLCDQDLPLAAAARVAGRRSLSRTELPKLTQQCIHDRQAGHCSCRRRRVHMRVLAGGAAPRQRRAASAQRAGPASHADAAKPAPGHPGNVTLPTALRSNTALAKSGPRISLHPRPCMHARDARDAPRAREAPHAARSRHSGECMVAVPPRAAASIGPILRLSWPLVSRS
eukprot:365055-Chlamydomonas_euryale.AAC.7